jgi:hypothetical protein
MRLTNKIVKYVFIFIYLNRDNNNNANTLLYTSSLFITQFFISNPHFIDYN